MKSQRILILGGRGRLAAALAREWSRDHEVLCLSRPTPSGSTPSSDRHVISPGADVSNVDALRRTLDEHRFDVLVNGTGMTHVDACEERREEARAVNVTAPQIMAEAARRQGARFLHFSTDYVFDGSKVAPYTEEDPAHPLGWYGRTKLDGEAAVLADSDQHLVVRVSWVFGPDKPSFVDMILNRARTHARVEAVADKFSCPTYAPDVAGWLEPFFDPALPGGLFHACNAGSCSWKEFAEEAIQQAAVQGVPLTTTRVEPLRMADIKAFTAPRPVHTVMSTAKLTRVTGRIPRAWQEAVRDYIKVAYAPISPAD